MASMKLISETGVACLIINTSLLLDCCANIRLKRNLRMLKQTLEITFSSDVQRDMFLEDELSGSTIDVI